MMFTVGLAACAVALLMVLVRAMRGPTAFDRLLAVNAIGTIVILGIALHGYVMGRPEFVDISILYAIINFIGTLAVLKLFDTGGLGDRGGRAKAELPGQEEGGNESRHRHSVRPSDRCRRCGASDRKSRAPALPDLYSRTHAVGMMDTAGVGFIILGLVVHEGFTLISVKLALVGIFLFFTSPISTHAVAQVAHRSGVKPVTGKGEETER